MNLPDAMVFVGIVSLIITAFSVVGYIIWDELMKAWHHDDMPEKP